MPIDKEEIFQYYGHRYTESEIRVQYPYSETVILKQKYSSGNYRITYDCYTAMKLRIENTPIVIWGGRLNGRVAFVFRCSKPKALAF